MHISKSLPLTLFICLGIFRTDISFAQNATLRGFVYEKETGEAELYANVFLKGTKISVTTDVNGYFSITCPAGNYVLMATFLGTDTLRQNVILKAGDIVTKKLYLKKSAKLLNEVEISAAKQEQTTEVKISVTTVTPKDIKQIPSVGGEPDFAQYLQVLPGVIFTGDQGGQLYIRGGAPVQNKVLLDGMIVYNPFHSIGLFSVFDADIIRNADVYTGGFNAEYGGRISSIMDITTRDGNKKRVAGKVQASPFGAKALVEGPLKKQKDMVNTEVEEKIVTDKIDTLASEIAKLNKKKFVMDSAITNLVIEKNKMAETLLKYAADTSLKAKANAINVQIKVINSHLDSVNNLRKANKFNIDSKNASMTLFNSDLEKLKLSESSSSFLISAKGSYLEQTSKVLYAYHDTAGLPFNFADFYGKASFNANNGSKINFFGFNFNDRVRYKAISNLNWTSYGAGSNFVVVPQNSPVLVEGNFAWSNYGISMTEAADTTKRRTSTITGFNMGLTFTQFMNNNELKYGLEVLGYTTDFYFVNALSRIIQQKESTTELAGFIKYKWMNKNKKLIIETGFRSHYYAALRNFSPEPRLGIKLNATSKLRFKMATGMYAQNLISATSDRDIVNLFYGFLSGPDNLPEKFEKKDSAGLRDVNTKLQKANHLIAGVEYDVTNRIDVNLEAYIKDFTQLTNLNRSKLFDDDADHADYPDNVKKDFILETGTAKGIDLLIKYDYKRLYLWAVYSLGFVDRWDGIQNYRPHFDRRHNVNLVGAYTFGKNLDWEVDMRWNFGSGFPFTQTAGFYENVLFTQGISSSYTQTNYDPNNPNSNSQLGILYGPLNKGKLPPYHRLDVTVKKKFYFGENSILEVSGGATNAYNRKNIFYYDRVKNQRIDQLPILPFISANWTF